jgi:hypothetical protein
MIESTNTDEVISTPNSGIARRSAPLNTINDALACSYQVAMGRMGSSIIIWSLGAIMIEERGWQGHPL